MQKKLIQNHRLPQYFQPERYRVILHPNLEKATFLGEETIFFWLASPQNKIELHAHEIKIDKVFLKSGDEEIKPKSIKYDKNSESVVIEFRASVPKGSGELKINFRGILNDKMRGFYRSQYTHEGKTHYIATTQFEATDARRAFPCVDEPSAKAIFDVTLIIPKDFRAISNTYETSVLEHQSGYQIIEFAPTPKMSTYLLAFIVGKFEFIETKTKEGVIIRVFTTPGKKHQASFALDVATKTLSYFSKYFGVAYPLPVLDLIAIPDFAAGAMENWGAVTYRESMLLVDPDHSSLHNKQWVALVIAHELAHQWFGNLVTMEWWTHLWLNEGFASWIEYLAVDHLFPEWKIWTQFLKQDFARALELDSLANTHPIEVPVRHTSEISEIFDVVSYSKGASVIRMLADYVGEKDFQKGLHHYLKRHQYANATTNDLWAALEEKSGKPIRKIMRIWTQKPGFPILKISQKHKFFKISQRRFFSSAVSRANIHDATRWPIPVSISLEAAKPKFYLISSSYQVPKRKAEWLKLNFGATGLFRVNYPIKIIERFAKQIEKKSLNASDRFNIENDAFALAESGELGTDTVLNLARSYRREDEYTVWADLAENIAKLSSLIEGTEIEKKYNEFGCDMFSILTRSLGWKKKKKESHSDSLLRSIAISQSGRYGDETVVKEAKRLFAKQINGKGHIHPDIRSSVYGIVAKYGNSKDYSNFLELYKNATLHEEKNRIGRAIGLFRKEKEILKTLKFIISGKVRTQDIPGIFVAVWASPPGRELAWSFLQKNWNYFIKNFGQGGHLLPRIISPAESFASNSKAREINLFFKKHPTLSIKRRVDQVIEKILSNEDWMKRDREKIEKWLMIAFPSDEMRD